MIHEHRRIGCAAKGFLAAAPDLFDGGTILNCVRAMIRDYLSWQGQAYENIESARQWLTEQENCSDKIGIIGFCMGGAFALLLAPGHGYLNTLQRQRHSCAQRAWHWLRHPPLP